MNNYLPNIFDIDSKSSNADNEIFESILNSKNVLIERIISSGQTTPEEEWYDQDSDEWVVLLQGDARLMYEDGSEIVIKAGNYIHLPAHKKHKVTYTSQEPPCIWLAIHIKTSM